MRNDLLIEELLKYPKNCEVLTGPELDRIKDVIYIPEENKNKEIGPLIVLNSDKD